MDISINIYLKNVKMGKRWFFVKWGDIIVKIIRFCVCINILSRLNSCRNNWKVFFFIFIISYYLLYYTILYLGLACFMIFSRLVRIQIFISTERSASALARRCPLLPATPFSFLPPRASAWSRTKRGYPLRVGLATLVLPLESLRSIHEELLRTVYRIFTEI